MRDVVRLRCDSSKKVCFAKTDQVRATDQSPALVTTILSVRRPSRRSKRALALSGSAGKYCVAML